MRFKTYISQRYTVLFLIAHLCFKRITICLLITFSFAEVTWPAFLSLCLSHFRNWMVGGCYYDCFWAWTPYVVITFLVLRCYSEVSTFSSFTAHHIRFLNNDDDQFIDSLLFSPSDIQISQLLKLNRLRVMNLMYHKFIAHKGIHLFLPRRKSNNS